jgi:hypothetical protein
VADTFGNGLRQIAQTDGFEDLVPRMLIFQAGANTFLVDYGPRVSKPNTTDVLVQRCVTRFGPNDQPCAQDGDCAGPFNPTCQSIPSEFDGYDWGADDDLPGLVVLGGHGTESRPRPEVRFSLQGRNRSAIRRASSSSVGWELNDSTKHSNVVAHMNVPQGLYQPVVQFDTCVGTPPVVEGGPCGSPQLFRVDGGPEVTSIASLPNKVTTLRIFAVSGVGPSVLSDLDNNGVVNSKDAVLRGIHPPLE